MARRGEIERERERKKKERGENIEILKEKRKTEKEKEIELADWLRRVQLPASAVGQLSAGKEAKASRLLAQTNFFTPHIEPHPVARFAFFTPSPTSLCDSHC